MSEANVTDSTNCPERFKAVLLALLVIASNVNS